MSFRRIWHLYHVLIISLGSWQIWNREHVAYLHLYIKTLSPAVWLGQFIELFASAENVAAWQV